ncbi:MAG: restriction endonuclease subunit S [Chitinophagaceae bacterium]|nr:restriction endonuclease subunit S [Chitinophagaceae bacterium]
MIKKYREYKLSKFKWFEHVPVNWHEGKISYFFEIGRGRVISELELNPDAPYPVYSSQTKNDGCLGFIDTYDFDDNILTWTTDGANAGTVFIRSGKFNCTNVCGTLKPKVDVDLKYYLYYLQTMTPFYKRPDTNGAKIMNNEMARIYCLIPPIQEQTKIAQYLDTQTATIDQLIQQKERLIELLKEKRQAVINEAVTKGLDFNARMKDTGIEWLGEVPKQWNLVQIRHLNTKVGSGVTPKGGAEVYTEEGVIFIRSQNVHFDGLRLDDVVRIDFDTHEKMSGSKVHFKDVLLNITGASIGRCCVVNISEEMNVNQHVCIIRPTQKILPEYLNLVLQSNVGQVQIKLGTTGGNREGLTFEAIKEFVIPLPDLKEQGEILSTVQSSLDRYYELENLNTMQIDKMKEYRQSIISEAVTGKIDVRDWQPNKKQVA